MEISQSVIFSKIKNLQKLLASYILLTFARTNKMKQVSTQNISLIFSVKD